MGKKQKQWQILFSWAPKSLWIVTAVMKLKDTHSLRDAVINLVSVYKKQRYHHAKKSLHSQSYEFCSYIRMWELDRKESWALKNWCFWIVALEMTLKSPLICKKIKPVTTKEKSFQNIHWKDWCWSWSSNTLATWFWNWFLWKRSWRWWRLKTKGEGNNQGWVVWVTSPTQWAWIWANSGDGEIQGSLAVVLQSQRFGYFFRDWRTRINT